MLTSKPCFASLAPLARAVVVVGLAAACVEPDPADGAGSTSDSPGYVADTDATGETGGDTVPSDANPVLPVHLPKRCAPGTRFCDHTDGSGVDDVGYAFGRGATWVDIDNDGWDDLWRCDGGDGYEGWRRTGGLFRNMGDGTFKRWDIGIPVEAMNHCWGAAWADVDNDGDQDVFFANGGFEVAAVAHMLLNDMSTTGGFTDISERIGLDPNPRHWWSAAFGDYDNDGLLDLFADAMSGSDPLSTANLYEQGRVVLYHNLGHGQFEDVTQVLPFPDQINDNLGNVKSIVWWDYDLDDDLDLFLPTERGFDNPAPHNWLFRNDAGAFTDVTADVLVGPLAATTVFSAATEDFDQDGHDDLYLGRTWSDNAILYARGGGVVQVVGPENGTTMSHVATDRENTMGLAVGDADSDGWPEVFIGAGKPDFAGNPLVFCHDGPSLTFHRCSDDLVAAQGETRQHGITLSDWDHDGDNDVYYNNGGFGICMFRCTYNIEQREIPRLYVNEAGPRQHTATVHLVGVSSNRDAIGARIAVTAERTHYYAVRSMQGFQSQNSKWILVVLGERDAGDVTVTWPSGAVTHTPIHTGERVEIREDGQFAQWPERVDAL